MNSENINKIEVRFISEEDLIQSKKSIVDLLEDNFKINFPGFSDLTKYAISAYDNMLHFKKDDTAILIGAFDQENLIGFLWAYEREILGDKRIHIGQIVVNLKVRSSGIGSKLLKYLEDYSSTSLDIKKIDLMATFSNEKAMKFYISNGFSIERVQLEKKLGNSTN